MKIKKKKRFEELSLPFLECDSKDNIFKTEEDIILYENMLLGSCAN